MLYRLYTFILWCLGFPDKGWSGQLHITDLLRTQKARLGGWWWLLSTSTMGGLLALMLHVIGWY